MKNKIQSEINIGMVGHVDHGKTSLVQALSGIWTDTHSEELRRGISIKLGYADCNIYKCIDCDPPVYTTELKCPTCSSKTEFVRKISFVDAPGHEILMARMLSGAAIMDGAVLVIAANEPAPQPQTREHLAALQITGITNIIIAQNKVELVSNEDAKQNHKQIRDFVRQTLDIDVPIVPISALHKANIDVITAALEKFIPTPKRDLKKPAKLYVARSFDINKPGATVDQLKGGVIGGTILEGTFKREDEIEIAPGIQRKKDGTYERICSVVTTVQAGGGISLEEAKPGGLIALGTKLDPSLTKGDGLVGNVVGKPDNLPPVWEKILQVQVTLLGHVVGLAEEQKVAPIKMNEKLMLTVGAATTIGKVQEAGKNAELELQRPVCIEEGSRIAISRRISGRWRLIGWGIVQS
ncbi:MAG: translation initiation factor IF-2 subunit gamma [Promethearchaeota archaeon]